MARYTVKFSTEQLREKIDAAMAVDPDFDPDDFNGYYGGYAYLTLTVEKDLKKVKFDAENLESEPQGRIPDKKVMGYHTLASGLTFCGFMAGGDWEIPLFFIIYWDGEKLRGYIPEDGNCYHKKLKTAFGNEGTYEEECEQCQAMVTKFCAECEKCKKCCQCADPAIEDLAQWRGHGVFEDLEIDQDKLLADIKARIIVR